MAQKVKILIVGGGITGLCAAHLFSKYYKRENVLLLESAKWVGGTALTDRVDGFNCDWGPNGWLDKEPRTKQWVKELGLEDYMVQANPTAQKRFILKNNALHEIKPPPAFLRTKILTLGGKMRLMREPLVGKKKNNKPESIYNFAVRRIGKQAADMLVVPMVSGVFGGDAKKLSLEHCFPKMHEMEMQYGSLYKALKAKKKEDPNASAMGPSGTLTSLRDGMWMLPAAAQKQLGDSIKTNCSVTKIECRDRQFFVQTADGTEYMPEALVMATPSHVAGELFLDVERGAAAALSSIPYCGINVLCAGFRREAVGHDLDGFGFLAPRKQGTRALGCLWTSSIFPNRAPEGWVLLRAMYGGGLDPEALKLSDKDTVETFCREMAPLLSFTHAPEFVRIFRHKKAIPQYSLDHGKHLRTIEHVEKNFQGLAFAGNAYRGIGINDCVNSAHRAFGMIKEQVQQD